MKNIFNKIGVVAGSVAVAVLPYVVSADTAFGTSTAGSIATTFFGEIALIIGGTVVGILSLLGALTGLGWAVRKYRHYVAGRKF